MNEVEVHAIELVRRREWLGAAELYDDLVGISLQKGTHKNTVVGFLLGRSECFYELGRHEAAIADCQHVLKLLTEAESTNANGTQAWRRIVYSLFAARRFPEAEAAAREWLIISGGATNQPEAIKMLERIRAAYQTANGQQMNPHQGSVDEEMLTMESRLQSWTGIGPPRQRKHPVELIGEPPVDPSYNHGAPPRAESAAKSVKVEIVGDGANGLLCSYCCIKFTERSELRAHCQSEAHQRVIMSDEGRDWAWRPPPRGITSEAYALCDAWADNAACRYGNQCVDAHGDQELAEWKERFEYRRMKLQRACEKELFGKAYTEQLLERWVSAPSPDKVMREKLDGVEDSCSADLATAVAAKKSTKEWVFTLVTDRPLRQVALLQDATRNHFSLRHVTSTDVTRNEHAEWTPGNDQEWAVPALSSNECLCLEHTLTVDFKTDIYGTFRQSVVFDFGVDPVLVKHLCVDVLPVDNVDKMKKIVKDLTLAAVERWDQRNSLITIYSAPSTPMTPAPLDGDRELELLAAYPSPRADTFALTQSTVQERRLTRNNYRARMHELLAVEEMARYEQVAHYNLTTKLRMADSYLLAPNGMATSTAKYAHSGELFALMSLGKDVSEDTSSGRLILNNCTTVLLAAARPAKKDGEELDTGKRVVYEALIEDKGKNVIYLRVSACAVRALALSADTDFHAEVQFQLNRVPYCEWHYAIDKIGDFRVIFPETTAEPNIPWTPQRQWSDADSRLNLKQKEAVVAITTPVGVCLPPILIIGPFGTGKTFTLAQAIKQLLRQNDTKILICTHSNSAADLYIKDYLHPHVEAGHEAARPLRIYYHKRWVATVNQTVQKYCLIELANGVRTFKIPTVADIERHRIVVVTLSISMYLATLGLEKGHFTHILLDEAAQAMECEAIMPLALASDSTRIVLAGDHMQLSPELFSQFAKERNLHVSLLERLYDHYPNTFPCKVLLCENYRAHEAIIKFTSELFYDQKLISSGKQPRHDKFYPLTFFTTRGEDVQDVNSTAFYNNSEVYEVVERVCELRKRWPPAWGKMDDQAIGIMTPYADQVFRIRSELRKRRMGGISVERVLNVQGKQFRAIFLSTVRTRRTCSSVTKAAPGGDAMDYGFLSNSKLLNTAITRAQSLVAVVGDPVALCSIGRCRKVWERFIEICNENKSLFGITWQSLRSQLDGVELKKAFVLNPLAPEFIPRSYQNEPYIRLPPSILGPVPPQMSAFGGQIPPYNPIYRYPVYPVFYPPQPGPPGPPPQAMFPMRPPGPIMFPSNPSPAAAGNPWAVNFPMISPPGAPGPPGVRASFFQKKPDPMDAAPPRIVGNFPANPSPVGDNYIPGGVISPASFLRGPGFPGPVVRERGDKEQIQFLQNVHFPERRPDLASLLPGNMNLQEMLESRSRQMEWYTHLMETQGPLAASKFRGLLMLGPQRPPSLSPALPHIDLGRTLEEMLASDKGVSMFHPIHMQPPQLGPMLPPSDLSSPKPLLLRDLEASMMQSRAEPLDSWQAPPHESVPLYRRQASDMQPATRGGSSGAFAGYARAAVSNGLEHRPPQQHQPQPMPQHQMSHQMPQQMPQQNMSHQMSQSMSQQMLSQQVNAEFGSEPTYAGALRSSKPDDRGDPLAVLRALGTRGDAQQSGLYQYFS